MSNKSKVIAVISLCLLAGAIAPVMFIAKSYRDNVALISQQSLSSAQKSFDSVKQNDVEMLQAVVTTVSDSINAGRRTPPKRGARLLLSCSRQNMLLPHN
jgi:hypothetical protein